MAAKNRRSAKGGKSVSQSSGKLSPDLERLEHICQLMERSQIAELEWERNGEKLRLRSRIGGFEQLPAQMVVASHAAPAPVTTAKPAPSAAAPAAEKPAGALPANQKQITSPFVGTFYRAPSPTADPYVREGQLIKRGDVLCIIEAMKLMNEIEAEVAGKIVSILVENGQPVEFGEPLFVVET